MKIAIHQSEGGFAPYWVAYCESKQIPYKLVCCYDNNIVQQIGDCDLLMWHHLQSSSKDVIFARQLLFALEQKGIGVFPDFNTGWHFDDKLGQKYLLEALGAPMVPSFVFYEKKRALAWLEQTKYPVVFKLRGGAGSVNVKLARSKRQARGLVKQAFAKGFKQYDAMGSLMDRFQKFRAGKASAFEVLKGIARLGIAPRYSKVMGREKGYVYFQTFLPGNDSDIRIIVIGQKAFALKRMVREDDFRASGSGNFKYEKEEFDLRCVQIAFEVTAKMKAQCVAFDFIFNAQNEPKIVEVSYGFVKAVYDACPGYFDNQLCWHEGKFDPQGWIIENVLKKLTQKPPHE